MTGPGIGHITAIFLICCSNVFTMCKTGKQLACYYGMVPFDRKSGISIKVNVMFIKATKNSKRSLHMCALTSTEKVFYHFKNA